MTQVLRDANMKHRLILTGGFVVVSPALELLFHGPPSVVFLAGSVSIALLADWVRRATEQVAAKIGPTIGGLINVSFGSLAELILALFVLTRGEVAVVRAQITGSILGTSLLGLGLAIVIGTFGKGELRFKREKARSLSTLLILVVIALLFPAVFDYAERSLAKPGHIRVTEEALSIGVSVILLSLYGANLVYTLVTRRDAFASDTPRDTDHTWSIAVSVGTLVVATVLIALEAELVSGALNQTSATFGLSPVFLGVIVLALIGTASDVFAATSFARQARMGLALAICIGSAIQMALVVAPMLVLLSWFIGHPMSLVFGSPLDLFAIASTAFIVNAIAEDGEATWFEGVLLVGVYLLFGLGYYFAAPMR